MIKAAFFDIDGTLVSFKTHSIPESAKQAIAELKRKGIKTFIATGRPLFAINNLEDLEFDGFITLNGAYCLNGKNEVVYKKPILQNNIESLIRYQEEKESFPCMFATKNLECFEAFQYHLIRFCFITTNCFSIPLFFINKIILQMDKIFKNIRRQDRLLDDKRACELLKTAEYGFLSLGTSENGYAYGIPISFAYSKDDNSLYFHCAPEGHKLENLKHNNKVSFCVVGKTKPIPEKFTTIYESVIVFGSADLNPSEEEKRIAIRNLVEKYCPEYIELGEKYMENSFHRTQTFKINIEHMSAKSKK